MDTEIEHSLRKFAANSNLSDVENRLEGRDSQAREAGCVNLMKFKMAKCRVLHLHWDNSKHKCRLGEEH